MVSELKISNDKKFNKDKKYETKIFYLQEKQKWTKYSPRKILMGLTSILES